MDGTAAGPEAARGVRRTAAVPVASLAVPLVAVAASACGLGPSLAWSGGVLLALGLVGPIARRLPDSVEQVSLARPLVLFWLVAALASNVQLVRLGAFMIDPGAKRFSVLPFDPFYARHSCLTCYLRGAELALAGEENVYLDEHYGGPGDRGDGFRQDHFSYPPPFLLLPLAELGLGDDFALHRKLWFVGQACLYAGAILAAARWIGRKDLGATLLALPVLALSMPVVMTLQFANFQMAALGLSMLSMLLFARRRPLIGGALLAFAALSKIFPGLLAAWLLARRGWTDAAWVAGWSIVFVALTFALLGSAPFTAFFTFQLPRIASGEAFPWLSSKESGAMIAANHSVPGIVWKLWYFDVPGMGRGAARLAGVLYQLALVALAWWSAKRCPGLETAEGRRATAMAWLALFNLAALSSPFAPVVYGVIGTLWLLVLLAPEIRSTGPRALPWILAWLWIASFPPSGGMVLPPVWMRMVLLGIGQLIGIALNLWVLVRSPRINGVPSPVN